MASLVAEGFIVHGMVQSARGRYGQSRLAYLGRLSDGQTFAAVWENYRPSLMVRRSDGTAATTALAHPETPTPSRLTTMDGEGLSSIEFDGVSTLRRAADTLRSRGIRTYEADLSPADPMLIDHQVHGSVTIEGEPRRGHNVDLVFMEPTIRPSEWEPALRILALDIETNPITSEILAVSLVSNQQWGPRISEVHFLGDSVGTDWIIPYSSEKEMLAGVVGRIAEIDPDIITGWNVIDFDFGMIDSRLRHFGISFAISRSNEPARFLPRSRDDGGRRQNASVACPGRQVIDGLRLVRYGPERFDDRKLGSVASAVLGVGKTVEAETSREKIETLLTLYRDDPLAFCEYCRTDSDLVLQILDRTGLLALTLKRCRLIGISLNRAWTSIPAFEFIYTESMHQRGLAAPTLGVDRLPQGEAPGGAILKPLPGVFRNVLVFDFKSLYPSLIRTFGIDPVGYVDREEGYGEGADPPPISEHITAPNGARFRRDDAILPAILDRFWASRDEAKRSGDLIASYVYKIIMNSFYGVLGSSGCRFAGSPLAGAITGFGQYILHWAKDRCLEAGAQVIYGDTDSLFVVPPEGTSEDSLSGFGDSLCNSINEGLGKFIRDHFDLDSKLELEFEKIYARFYLPRIRHAAGGDSSEVRGRAKGYAGLAVNPDGGGGTLEIKGMEAIRSDWTSAAGDLQSELLMLLFSDKEAKDLESHVRETILRLKEGDLDERLVYAKRLRKPVGSYTKTRPPHVQAAALLPVDEQEGFIHYLITVDGPQPVSQLKSRIDHAHYLEKQLKPIAEPICEILGLDAGDLFDPSQQLSLF